VRLLLEEMISATVAEQLRVRGHDVVAVQDPDMGHLRGIDDCVLLDHAATEHRAVVTDNVPDFVRCHQRRVDRGQPHHGLLLFANDTFPRHRHDAFVGQLLTALEDQLLTHPDDNDSSWIRWLTKAG
jgi:predicted nuclease of predicted toxin-antitoxin system